MDSNFSSPGFSVAPFAPAVGILLNYHSERMATISPHC